MEQIYCACLIANLEGIYKYVLPRDNLLTQTLEDLDSRTRKLEENTRGLLPPPPPVDPTWTSLAWRVARLVGRSGNDYLGSAQAIPTVPLDASMDLLYKIMASLGYNNLGIISISKGPAPGAIVDAEKDGDDEETVCGDKDAANEIRLVVIRQNLCHTAGLRGKRIVSVPYGLADTCWLAMQLSLECERQGMTVTPPPRAWVRPNPGMAPMGAAGTKCVCTCCARGCTRRGRRSRKMPQRNRRWAGNRVAGFFRKLAWWKGNTSREGMTDSGSDSDSDSSSGTSIVDH